MAHFVNNTSIVIYIYFSGVNIEEAIANDTGDNYSIVTVIVGLAFFIVLTVLTYRKAVILRNT